MEMCVQDLEAGGYVTHEGSSGHAGENDDVAAIDMRDL